MSKFIERQDFQEMTGAVQPARICQRLREEGIRFVTRYDGWPSLTWEAYTQQICGRKIPDNAPQNDEGFNLEAAASGSR